MDENFEKTFLCGLGGMCCGHDNLADKNYLAMYMIVIVCVTVNLISDLRGKKLGLSCPNSVKLRLAIQLPVSQTSVVKL